MTLTELEKLEALHDKPQQMLDEGDMKAYYRAAKELENTLPKAFPEMAKALREAWALCAEYDRERAEWIATVDRLKADSCTLMKERDEARVELGEALDELAYIREEYGDGDPAEMTADALMVKVKVITLDYNDAQAEVERMREHVEWLLEGQRQYEVMTQAMEVE